MSYSITEGQDNVFLLGVFSSIAILFTAISGFQAYIGYKSLLGSLSALSFALVMSLAMLFLNFALRMRRIHGGDATGIATLLFVIIFFMFLGDFNAIYKRFAMTGGVINIAVEDAGTTFQSNMENAKRLLSEKPGVSEIIQEKQKLDNERENLRQQIIDANNPGMGAKAKKHLENIGKIIGTPVTSLKPPPAGAALDEFIKYADSIDELTLKTYKNSYQSSDKSAMSYKAQLDNIDELSEKYKSAIDEFLSNPEKDNNIGKMLITRIKKDSDETKNTLMRHDITASFEEIQADAGDAEEISQTFKSAFYTMPKPMITIITALITLLLNFLVPLITFAYYKPGQMDSYFSNHQTSKDEIESI